MEKVETLESFYKEKYNQTYNSLNSDKMQFNILSNADCLKGSSMLYRRREFYKVAFFKGHCILHYGDKSLEVNSAALAFFKPDVPYTIDMLEDSSFGGYFIFREPYFNDYYRSNIRELPLFKYGNKPVYLLNKSQEKNTDRIFKKLQREMASDYQFKHDLIRNNIVELIHFALKMQPTEKLYQLIDSKVRITTVFNELLERQFPIESPNLKFELRSAQDFAKLMNVHVNYLNRAIKSSTGKTTTEVISEKVVSEAIALLKHSNWNISEIGYSLGFEDPSHFNHFFKKQTQQAPSNFRRDLVAYANA